MRRPSYPFNVYGRPFQIVPFCAAPVLPGDTLKQFLLQSRVVSDPIKNPLIGWHQEYYLFYVKHRDLAGREDFTKMMLDLNHDLSAYNHGSDNAGFYAKTGQISWIKMAYDRIVETYFRDEDEALGAHVVGAYELARVNQNSWMDSLLDEDAYTAGDDVDVDLNADDTITAGEVDEAMRTYMYLREHQMTDMSYEDYLASHGIRPRPEEFNRPELLRYVRQWTYPTNHIDPTDGSPSSAVSWAIAERGDKDRFFREPGFVIGLTVSRPKVYLGYQTSSLIGTMNDALAWLPRLLADDPNTSLRHHAAASQPLGNSADGYWYDLKDLFLYGEQFVNHSTADNGTFVSLPPTADASQWRYLNSTDIDSLFVLANASAKFIKQDGRIDFHILSSMVDTTPQGIQG